MDYNCLIVIQMNIRGFLQSNLYKKNVMEFCSCRIIFCSWKEVQKCICHVACDGRTRGATDSVLKR
jgi:hypothetical protein